MYEYRPSASNIRNTHNGYGNCLDAVSSSLPLLGDIAGIPILDPALATSDDEKEVDRFQKEQLIGARMCDIENTIARGGEVLVVCAEGSGTGPHAWRNCVDGGL